MTDDASTRLLAPLRARIDAIDARIVAALTERLAVVDEVVVVKRRHGIPARIPKRVEAVVTHVRAEAEKAGCPPGLAEQVWRALIDWTIRYEDSRPDPAHPEQD